MRFLTRWTLLLLILAAPCLSLGQERERIIILQSPTDLSCPIIKNTDGKTVPTNLMALELVSISIGKKPVTLGQPFMADDDWMKDLKVRVRNVSGRPLVHVWLDFTLPEAEKGEVVTGFSLNYGTRLGAVNTEAGQKLVLDGEEFELTHTAAEYERDREWIMEWSGVMSITRAWFGRAAVRFEDDMVWGGYPKISGMKTKLLCPPTP